MTCENNSDKKLKERLGTCLPATTYRTNSLEQGPGKNEAQLFREYLALVVIYTEQEFTHMSQRLATGSSKAGVVDQSQVVLKVSNIGC